MMKFFTKAMVIFSLWFAFLHAHPPSDIIAEYDTSERTLRIVVEHNVKNVSRHYVNKIEIWVGREKKIEQTNTMQEYESSHSYLYKIIDVKFSDTLNVIASCNISGKKRIYFIFTDGKLEPINKERKKE